MIKLEIDSVNYDIDDDLRSRIVDRIGSLDEYMSDLEGGATRRPRCHGW